MRFVLDEHKGLSKPVERHLRDLAGASSGYGDLTPKVAALAGVIPPDAGRGERRGEYADHLAEKCL